MTYDLPTQLNIGGVEREIRTDYRAILDICMALSDPDLSDQEKALACLDIFYPCLEEMPVEDYREALEKCFWFINCGDEEPSRKTPKLVDWEQDFKYIVAPINRVCGQDIRAIPYDGESNTGGLHWWTFISYYYEIGDCLFAQIVNIRNKRAKGKKLDKAEKDWLRDNRHLVDFKRKYSTAEEELVKQWT